MHILVREEDSATRPLLVITYLIPLLLTHYLLYLIQKEANRSPLLYKHKLRQPPGQLDLANLFAKLNLHAHLEKK